MSSFTGTPSAALAAIALASAEHALDISNTIEIIEAAAVTSVPALDADSNTISGDVVVDSGSQWFQWKIAGTPEFTDNSKGSTGNQSFTNVLTVFVPLKRDAVNHQLNLLLNGEFLVRFGTIDGTKRLMGTEFSAAMIAEGGIQGVINGEQNGFTVTFQNHGRLVPNYTGAVAFTPAP